MDFAAVLRSDVWTDGMQRFVGVNPRAASATDWHARKMPRRPLPAERQRPPHTHRAQAVAGSDSPLASGSTLIIPDRGAVVSDEVRWGCHSRDAAPARALNLFGYSSSVFSEDTYRDPQETSQLLGTDRKGEGGTVCRVVVELHWPAVSMPSHDGGDGAGRCTLSAARPLSPNHDGAGGRSMSARMETERARGSAPVAAPTTRTPTAAAAAAEVGARPAGAPATEPAVAAGGAGAAAAQQVSMLLGSMGISEAAALGYAAALAADGFDTPAVR